jgi:hypothetical protein
VVFVPELTELPGVVELKAIVVPNRLTAYVYVKNELIRLSGNLESTISAI